jgi:tetratricopeptide (TPR) repeat protein
VDLDPQNGAYLDSLGWAQFKLGNYESSEEFLRKAEVRNSTDPTIQDHLAELYAKTGKLKQAVAHWERAMAEWNRTVSADVDPADVARVQKKLESTRVKVAKQQRD